MAKYTKDNRMEIPDPKPVALPVGTKIPESLEQMMARMIRSHSIMASKQGFESFEEAEDFGEDDHEMKSEHQFTDMQEEHLYVKERDGSGGRRTTKAVSTDHNRRVTDKSGDQSKDQKKSGDTSSKKRTEDVEEVVKQ